MTPHTNNSVGYRRVEEGMAELGFLHMYVRTYLPYIHVPSQFTYSKIYLLHTFLHGLVDQLYKLYMYVCMYSCLCVCAYMCAHVHECVHACMHMYVYMYVCRYVYA